MQLGDGDKWFKKRKENKVERHKPLFKTFFFLPESTNYPVKWSKLDFSGYLNRNSKLFSASLRKMLRWGGWKVEVGFRETSRTFYLGPIIRQIFTVLQYSLQENLCCFIFSASNQLKIVECAREGLVVVVWLGWLDITENKQLFLLFCPINMYKFNIMLLLVLSLATFWVKITCYFY